MTNQNITSRLTEIFHRQFHIEQESIDNGASLDGFGADSLDRVELSMLVEAEFDIVVEVETADKLETFGQWVECVQTALDAGGQS